VSYGLEHRTYGETRNCKGCRYWSEMIARTNDNGCITALCLANGTRKGQWTPAYLTCEAWASGHLGAIDEPGQDPAAYESEGERP
jgi:hypothetical protein